jgi:hypothetical protein
VSIGSGLLAAESAIGLTQMATLTLLYGLRSNWRSSPAGLVLLGSFGIKAIIFGMILLGRLIGPLGIVPWVIAVGAFDLIQFGWLWLVIREQASRRDCPPDEPSL